MRVQRSSSTDGKRKYVTAQFNGHDVLAALAEYVVSRHFITEEEMRGFKLHWNVSLRYVEGHGIQQSIYLKTAQEVKDESQPETHDEEGQGRKNTPSME